MSYTDTGTGSEFLEAMQQAADILLGKLAPSRFHAAPAAVDVRAIRKKLGLSQAIFARRFGFSAAAVREWEQGRRRPEQAARTLLLIIASRPDVVEAVLAEAAPPGVETAAAFLHRRAGDAKPENLRAILALAPDRDPEPGDEMPEGG